MAFEGLKREAKSLELSLEQKLTLFSRLGEEAVQDKKDEGQLAFLFTRASTVAANRSNASSFTRWDLNAAGPFWFYACAESGQANESREAVLTREIDEDLKKVHKADLGAGLFRAKGTAAAGDALGEHATFG